MSIPTERDLLISAADNLLNAANGFDKLNPTLARRLGAAVINDKSFGVDYLSRSLMEVESLAQPVSAEAVRIHRSKDAALATLTAERDALRKDAERYRWLRSDGIEVLPGQREIYVTQERLPFTEDADVILMESELDAAIDAAMTKEPK